MLKLKECPFCGGSARLVHKDNCNWQFYVYCATCYACTSVYDEPEHAQKAWNKRVPQRTETMKVYDSFGNE